MRMMTSKRWTRPPRVYEVTIPSSHKINSTTAIVHNMGKSLSYLVRRYHTPERL